MMHAYADRRGLSYMQVIKEPWDEIVRAHYIWELQAERDKLEVKRQSE